MKKINRRRFLKKSASAVAAANLPAFWLPRSARAAGLGPKKLVLFFMNGGNDGMNTIVPTTTYQTDGVTELLDSVTGPGAISQYNHYKNLRPAIHLKKDAIGPGPYLLPLGGIPGAASDAHRLKLSNVLSQANVSAPGGTQPVDSVEFSLHPAFANLLPIWNAGHMAIFPATHSGPNSNRSHFFQTEYIGHGLYTNHSNQLGDAKGWVGRYFEAKYGTPSLDGIEGFDFEAGYSPLMDGNIPVLAMSNPERAYLGRNGDKIKIDTLAANALREGGASQAYLAYAKVQEELFARVAKLDTVDYTSVITYPNSSTGDRFRRAAALIKDPVIGAEIEVINIDRGGFDTHGAQVDQNNSALGTHARALQDCADSIKAFYDDMALAGCGDEVMVLVQTEFGRTADENNNFATDHARAACWLAVGGQNAGGTNKNIHGGLYGTWPGIGTDNLGNTDLDGSSRFYLHQATDYRDILAEIISDYLDSNGVDASAPFNPGSTSDYSRTAINFVDV